MQNVSELTPVSMAELAEMARHCNARRVYLHWTAGHYGQVFEDYHISIDEDGKLYTPWDCRDLDQYRQHTYMRNSGAIGIAVCCCYGATANSGYNACLGDEPITPAQIEAMSMAVAVICKNAGISIERVMTHCEAALQDGYGPFQGDPDLRWDLWFLPDYDGQMRPGGDVIRGKALWYMLQSGKN